ncbi:hypothetical protein LR48_Vigan06g142800 [Vigna angularis]|uniref:Uncharacterized protein n=1 Tax=Phaseolus angularis TaxID=3914 RepID=A0A0L9UU67_PHAAN|nr:hypothetical protein LR48_Vigan06g142800 [Vigna angularis]
MFGGGQAIDATVGAVVGGLWLKTLSGRRFLHILWLSWCREVIVEAGGRVVDRARGEKRQGSYHQNRKRLKWLASSRKVQQTNARHPVDDREDARPGRLERTLAQREVDARPAKEKRERSPEKWTRIQQRNERTLTSRKWTLVQRRNERTLVQRAEVDACPASSSGRSSSEQKRTLVQRGHAVDARPAREVDAQPRRSGRSSRQKRTLVQPCRRGRSSSERRGRSSREALSGRSTARSGCSSTFSREFHARAAYLTLKREGVWVFGSVEVRFHVWSPWRARGACGNISSSSFGSPSSSIFHVYELLIAQFFSITSLLGKRYLVLPVYYLNDLVRLPKSPNKFLVRLPKSPNKILAPLPGTRVNTRLFLVVSKCMQGMFIQGGLQPQKHHEDPEIEGIIGHKETTMLSITSCPKFFLP